MLSLEKRRVGEREREREKEACLAKGAGGRKDDLSMSHSLAVFDWALPPLTIKAGT